MAKVRADAIFECISVVFGIHPPGAEPGPQLLGVLAGGLKRTPKAWLRKVGRRVTFRRASNCYFKVVFIFFCLHRKSKYQSCCGKKKKKAIPSLPLRTGARGTGRGDMAGWEQGGIRGPVTSRYEIMALGGMGLRPLGCDAAEVTRVKYGPCHPCPSAPLPAPCLRSP